MISIPIAATGVSLLPVAAKAVGELVLQSNTLARQGNGTPSLPGIEETLARQRAGGIGAAPLDGFKKKTGYLEKVPSKPTSGDFRQGYKTKLGNATSSRGRMLDILGKVPRRTVGGSTDYEKACRKAPSNPGGYGNQSFTP